MKFKEKVGESINVDKMINMLLLKLSKRFDIFFMERRTYKKNKVSKSYYIKYEDKNHEGETENFNNKRQVLIYLTNLYRR